VQECPAADVAIAALVVAVLRALCAERWCDLRALAALDTQELADVLWAVAKDGERAVVAHPGLLAALGRAGARPAGALWRELAEATLHDSEPLDDEVAAALRVVLDRGPLARRMLGAAGPAPDRSAMLGLSTMLADSLRQGVPFVG